MRATRYFLKQSITIHSIPCFLARSQSCVSGHKFTFLHRSTGSSRFLELMILGSFGPSQCHQQPAQELCCSGHQREPNAWAKPDALQKGTKTREAGTSEPAK